MRFPLLAAAVALVAGCSKSTPAPGMASGAAPAAEAPVTIRLQTDWYPQAEHGGFYQAQAKGFYKEAGVDVAIQHGGPGPLVTQIMMAGNCDVAIGSSDGVLYYLKSGLPVIIIGAYMQHDPQAILVHDESEVKGFADLNGKTVMAVPGSDWIYYLESKYHMSFNLIPSNFGLAQFMADKGFIQQCFITNEPYFVRKNGQKPRALLISDSGFNPYRILYTTKRFAKEHPKALKAFIAASIRGWDDFMNGDPTPAKKAIAAENPHMSEEFMDYSIQAMRQYQLVTGKPELGERTGLMTEARLRETAKTLADLKITPAETPLEDFATFEFLPDELQVLAKK